MTDLIERLREAFQRKRYGAGDDYDPDFDLFDVAADEIERLRAFIQGCATCKEAWDEEEAFRALEPKP